MIERKCLKCGQWNKGEDYCVKCGAALSPKAVDREKTEKRKLEEAEKEPSKIDVWMEKAKNSKNVFIRGAYYFVYSITVIAGLIGAFLAWMMAMVNA